MCKVYLVFYRLKKPKNRKTDIWEIITIDKSKLGYIKFRGAWRQFVFEPASDTHWNINCLEQIADFLNLQNTNWRNRKRI